MAQTFEDLSREVGDAYRMARRQAHITQAQVGDNVGIAQPDISRIESGGSNPSLVTLERLADGIGCTLEVRFVEEGK